MSCLAFRTTSLLVLFLLLAGSALQTQGKLISDPRQGAAARELRCQCVNVVSQRISAKSIASVNVIPEGPHCIRPEVIFTRKDGKQFCVNTTMPWVQKVIQIFAKQTSNL